METEYKFTHLEKIKKFLTDNIIWLLSVVIIIILICVFFPTGSIESNVTKKTKKFLDINHITINNGEERYFRFKEIDYKIKKSCYEDGSVIVKNNNGVYTYKVLYICGNEYSKDLKSETVSNSQIILNGPNPLFVKAGYTYEDPGYTTIDSNLLVKTEGTVSNQVGMYLIKYVGVNSNGQNIEAKRFVIVTAKDFTSSPIIKLNGDNYKIISRGTNYYEEGYRAIDYKDGDLTSKVAVDGYVNSSTVGTYMIKYTVTNSSNNTTTTIRTVKVVENLSELNITTNYTPTTLTNTDVTININANGEGFFFFLDPDGEIIKEKNYAFLATENGDYEFVFKKKDGTILEKIITISNIDKTKPTGSCKNTITENRSTVTVTANDEKGIKEYSYTIDGVLAGTSALNSYTINKESEQASVTIYDNAGNHQILTCVVDNQVRQLTSVYSDTEVHELKYLLFIPEGLYASRKNPLVVFLHGSGECGTNIHGQFNSNTAFVNSMKAKTLKNAIYIAPQCDCNYSEYKETWTKCLTRLKKLIDYVVQKYNVDEKRISITGHSLGGNGVYEMINAYPNMFSVGVPLAGRIKSSGYINNITGTKIRSYCGTQDGTYANAKSSIDKLKAAGGDAEFVALEGEGHIIQKSVYTNTDVLDWMIKQSR